MVEFAIVLPLLLVVLVGIVQFAIFFYQYVIVENAAATGLRTFLMNKPLFSTTCTGSTPYSSTVSAIQTATGGLDWSSVTYSMSANGSPCATDAACSTNLCNALLLAGPFSTAQTASVTVSYPCLTLLPASWAPSFCPGGTLTATNTQNVH